MITLRIITDGAMEWHDPGPGHPERPARLQVLREMVERERWEGMDLVKPRAAAIEVIKRVHSADYVDRILALRGKAARLDADTAVSPASVDAALLAAGAAIDAVDTVMRGETRRAFALVRPPGHHAEKDRAMGFCLFNNIAIAAQHAIDAYHLSRVLIVDWDVHHGNGTQHIFEDRSDVLFFSSHQWPLYPGTGAAEDHGVAAGKGFTVNVPLPAGTDDASILRAYEERLMPAAEYFRPELVLVSAGFDGHALDPLANFRLTENGFASLCRLVRRIAAQHANDRLALMLEGGYNVEALTGSVRACIEALLENEGSVIRAQ